MNQRWGRKRDFREIAFLTLVSYMAVLRNGKFWAIHYVWAKKSWLRTTSHSLYIWSLRRREVLLNTVSIITPLHVLDQVRYPSKHNT
jgi:hypothetical protein